MKAQSSPGWMRAMPQSPTFLDNGIENAESAMKPVLNESETSQKVF
jgi:hypothetical protein